MLKKTNKQTDGLTSQGWGEKPNQANAPQVQCQRGQNLP